MFSGQTSGESAFEAASSAVLMSITDHDKDLLRLLVVAHGATGGKQFTVTRSTAGFGLGYPGGISLSINFDDIAFRQLRSAASHYFHF